MIERDKNKIKEDAMQILASKKKLILKKETIAFLNPHEMQEIQGGSICPPPPISFTCTADAIMLKITGQTCSDG